MSTSRDTIETSDHRCIHNADDGIAENVELSKIHQMKSSHQHTSSHGDYKDTGYQHLGVWIYSLIQSREGILSIIGEVLFYNLLKILQFTYLLNFNFIFEQDPPDAQLKSINTQSTSVNQTYTKNQSLSGTTHLSYENEVLPLNKTMTKGELPHEVIAIKESDYGNINGTSQDALGHNNPHINLSLDRASSDIHHLNITSWLSEQTQDNAASCKQQDNDEILTAPRISSSLLEEKTKNICIGRNIDTENGMCISDINHVAQDDDTSNDTSPSSAADEAR